MYSKKRLIPNTIFKAPRFVIFVAGPVIINAAADPTLIPLWIAFGLGEYSVSATSVLSTRKHISLWTKDEACALADKIMKLKTASEVYEALQEAAR
jgi:phosphoenolpyruvate-protein kinase (PTS system EI component)